MENPLIFEQASEKAHRYARRLARHSQIWLCDRDDLYQVGMCGWAQKPGASARIYWDMIDELRRMFGRRYPHSVDKRTWRIDEPGEAEQGQDHVTPESLVLVWDWIAHLPPRLQRIITLLGEGRSEREIGDMLGLTEGRISQLRTKMKEMFYDASR